MGISTSWSDILQAVLPWSESYAEEPEKDEEKETDAEDETKNESSVTEPEAEGEEGEEEEEEDLVDPQVVLEEECKNSKACSPAKHHYEECVERVTSGHGAKNEDCVEEFFHLIHCASTCAAPKLWKALK